MRKKAVSFLSKPFSETIVRSEEQTTTVVQPINSLKRKNEDAEIAISKRVEIDETTSSIAVPAPSAISTRSQAPTTGGVGVGQDDDEESDNESVHLNMELDSEEDDDDDDSGAEEN